MKIQVTQDHIDYGTPGDKNKCPICNALKAVFPHKRIEVGGIFASINEKLYKFTSDPTCIDNHEYPTPFEFDICPAFVTQSSKGIRFDDNST